MMKQAGSLVAVSLLLCACGVDALKPVPPPPPEPVVIVRPTARCAVSPEEVNLVAGDSVTFIGAESLDESGTGFVAALWTLGSKPAGSSATLPVCAGLDCGPFTPDVPGVYVATLAVTTAQGVSDTCSASFAARESAGPTARCDVSPSTVNPLTAQAATLTGSGSFDPDGYPLSYDWRLVVQPEGSSVSLPVCAASECGPLVADLDGEYVVELTVTNALGQSSSCTTTLSAVTTGQGPVAVCAVTPAVVRPPFEASRFDGSASYDPDGLPLTSLTWQLESAPQGSAVTLPTSGAPFTPDVAGVYVARLTVVNAIGLRSSCTATLEAVPEESLWIEMYWSVEKDDMDLHLLRPGAQARSAGDCYFMNCIARPLAWGESGNEADDPQLELDDILGTGPENINIASPAPGTYKVLVHDFPRNEFLPANQVTVTVYIGGAPVFTSTRSVAGEDTDTYFCEIAWPSGVVTPL